ncbi:MAG: hypothetical protein N7Q72_07140, partial [Spiroplasma sp. Tabriz.8]|nr:hypothetical protein [Spiroplasma sp. Tabriz.8]
LELIVRVCVIHGCFAGIGRLADQNLVRLVQFVTCQSYIYIYIYIYIWILVEYVNLKRLFIL